MDQDLWVFGYGSLMWRPGFKFVESRIAMARGYRRSLCIYSHVHRGTPERPGLVLGLDRGGSCKGVAFRIDAGRKAQTVAYLRERELVTSVYLEKLIPVEIDNSRRVMALAYVVDRTHSQYARGISRETSLQLINQGVGQSGENLEYVRNTVQHLDQLGITDRELAWYGSKILALEE